MIKTVITFCILMLTLKNFAQAPKETTDAIRKLGFLEGIWKGKGWIGTGDKKQHFNETETAGIKTGETLLQIDVYGTSADNDSVIINNGLAIISYDLPTKKYKMIFFQSDGSVAKADVSLPKENTAEINLHRKSGYTRFIIEAKNS
ncbi:MAG TPA: hypothetical protein VJU78_15555, partial [Chitinophagaceae bacterium]|nr:hypothetical protein [Chitinophagaceae bacterium]